MQCVNCRARPEARTAWRERPRLVAAGVIAKAAKSRGRSRHGTAIDPRADGGDYGGQQRAPAHARIHNSHR